MSEATHIFDPQGEVIIILQRPDYEFAPWNECETECEPVDPQAKVGEINMSNDVAYDESHEGVGRRKRKGGKRKKCCVRSGSGKPNLTTAEPPSEEPRSKELPSKELPVEAPPVEAPPAEQPIALDEQLEVYPNATFGNRLENACDRHDKATMQTYGNEEHVEEDCFRIQVSAKHLILSSPVFNKTLTGGWKEGFHLLREGSVEITTSGWDLEAFLILMRIFHCQPQDLPQRISLELLAKVAVLADYYGCQTVVRFFADKWIDVLKDSFPTSYSRDLILWIWVSWSFRLCPQFENSTSIAISESNDLITDLGLPIPGTVIGKVSDNLTKSASTYVNKCLDEMNLRRHDAISVIFSTLNKRRDAFLSGSRGCSFECGSIMFGALTKHMHSNSLLSPQPRTPFIGLNYNGLMKAVHDFKSPEWNPSNSSYSSFYQHSCGDSSISSLINNIPEDAAKGLSLSQISLDS